MIILNKQGRYARFSIVPTLYVAAILGLLTLGSSSSTAQVYLFDKIQLYDETSNKSVMVAKPDNIATTQQLTMPSTTPTEGQLLSIANVSGSNINLGWSSAVIGTKPPSNRLTSAQDAASPSGLSVVASASKVYLIYGIILANRKSSGSDNLNFTVTAPTGSTRVDLTVRCYNCPTSTTNTTQFNSAAAASVTSLTINPAGATEDYTQSAYGIEAKVICGSNAGNITITATNAGSNTNNVIIGAQSYILSLEVQ